MLLSLIYLQRPPSPQPPPPSKALNQSSPLFPIPQTLFFQTVKNPSKSLVRCSISDSQTLPQSAIERIANKLRSLGLAEDNPSLQKTNAEPETETKGVGEIFIPLPNKLPKCRVGHTLDPSWSTPEKPGPAYHEKRNVAKKEKELWNREEKKEKVPTLAELSLSKAELRRLTTIGIAEKRKLKIGKMGITEGILNGIHERWRNVEVVKIFCEDLCGHNMKRTHELLERKSGGMVVWRSGSKIILYRGANYKYPYFILDKNPTIGTSPDAFQNTNVDYGQIGNSGPSPTNKVVLPTLIHGVGSQNRVRFQLPGEAQLAEEADRLLDGLGPRFTDWWGYDPLPVDADLLPAVVPRYRRPFRLLPYGINPKLTDDEMNSLKRLGRPLPCHFALGRNKNLQGLAAAIVKLWEKCEIAKIAVKRGMQNTNSELMVEELKRLTGGTLLSRDSEFIFLYRGKDFLPSAVSAPIEERRKHGRDGNKWIDNGTPGETAMELKVGPINSVSRDKLDCINNHGCDLSEKRKLRSAEAAVRRTSSKLSMALEKKKRAEKLLAELDIAEMPQQPEIDKDGITEEEKYMLRKVGLKMKPFLLMGRRGVFDGTVQNMHLHWKYRELVKIVCKEKNLEAVRQAARTLEAESGGILVGVERVSKGYAIIVYRGKNYRRPACLRPPTLMSKREAMKSSLEAQRRKSLQLHVLRLNRNIKELKHQLVKDKEANHMPSSDEARFQTRGKHGDDLDSVNSNSTLDASVNDAQPAQQATDVSSIVDDNETGKSESEFPSGSVSQEACSQERCFSPLVNFEHRVSDNEAVGSMVESAKNELQESFLPVVQVENETPSRVHLTNKDRLLLRKQALKMKKRPVLAVGRSNIVTGVAKAIKAHFQKHPLAIVNVKGIAKGTSIREVALKLEQATGAVLVSQEPCKVILYRGWGAEDEPGLKGKKNTIGSGQTSMGRDDGALRAVSPELVAAIRLECGLQQNQEKKPSPGSEV